MMSSSFDATTIYTSTSAILCLILLSVYAYVRFTKLQVRPECISLRSEGTDCATTLPRPPPLPDPPRKQSKSKALLRKHKILLNELRYQQQLRRLQRRQDGIAQKNRLSDVASCQQWCKMVYLPVIWSSVAARRYFQLQLSPLNMVVSHYNNHLEVT
jgi:hypothetical protein